jgi:transcriptional regulator with XRE-family HTH domain
LGKENDIEIQQLCSEIGMAVRDARIKHKWSIAVLAGETGLSDQCINRIERGKTAPKISTIYSLCVALGISSDKLLGLDQIDIESTPKAELDAINLLNQLNAAELKYVTNQIKGLLEITRTKGF